MELEGCLDQNCGSLVDVEHMEICVENEDDDEDDHEDENENDDRDGEAEDNQNNENNNANGGGRRLSSSATGYTFLPSGGQECGRAGAYALSVKGFKLDTWGISQQTWGYGGKQVDLLLTLSTSDEGNSHNSNDSADEGYAIGYCEITLKTGRNPPQLAIVGVATAALCSLVFYMAYIKEERKARAPNDENAKDYDSMTDASGGSLSRVIPFA